MQDDLFFINDPIHGIMTTGLDEELKKILKSLIGTKEFQRL